MEASSKSERMNASLENVACQVVMNFSNIYTVNRVCDISPILNIKKMVREKTKNCQICQLALYILQNKKVENFSAKKYVLSSC